MSTKETQGHLQSPKMSPFNFNHIIDPSQINPTVWLLTPHVAIYTNMYGVVLDATQYIKASPIGCSQTAF